MNYLKITFIAVILQLMTANSVMAARQGFLFLGTSRQSITGSYDFTSSSYGKSSSHDQRITENYGFGIDYAIFKPDILVGVFNVNLLASQTDSSDSYRSNNSTSKLGFLYDISGDFFAKSTSPFKVMYKSQVNDVQRSFGGSYKLNSDIFGANWVIKNKTIPLAVSYSRSISSTDGTPDDRTFTNEEINIHASHSKGGSETYLDLTNANDHYDSNSGLGNGSNRRYKGSLRHSLLWDVAGLRRSLTSSVTIEESASLFTRSSTIDWHESILWDLGKALKSNLNYNYGNSTTDRGRQQSNAVIGQLQHSLFSSLTTSLQVNGRYYDDNYGSESEISGRVSLVYRKILPFSGTLDLGGYKQYGITDRVQNTQSTLRRTAFKEPHTVVFGQRTVLVYPDYIPGSLFIYNASARIRPANLFYSEGIDFRVDTTNPLAEIIVVPGSSLDVDISSPDGNSLLITYDYRFYNIPRYATNSQGVNGSIGLMGGTYRIFAGIDQSNEESLSGTVQSSQLNYHTRVNVGLNAKWYKYLLSTEVTRNDATFDRSRTLDSSLDYTDIIWKGTLALYLKDSHRWYEAGADKTQRLDTVVSTGGNYIIPAIFYGSMTVRADYTKWLSVVGTDRFSIGAYLRWKIRKFVISLQSNFSYNRIGENLSESESFGLHISRYF